MCVWARGACIRNFPQIVIQFIYIYETGSVDIFVSSAMLFSICSVIVSLFSALSGRFKAKSKVLQSAEYHYTTKEVIKMKIECDKLKSYHKYIHKLLTEIICGVLCVDDIGNIEVFYIVSARNSIIAYIEILTCLVDSTSPRSTSSTMTSNLKNDLSQIYQFAESNSPLNVAFKQEINEKLNLDVVSHDRSQPGQRRSTIGNTIIVSITKENVGFSSDVGAVVQLSA